MIVLVQLSLDKHPELPDVPLVMDFAKTDEQRQILKMIFARNVMGRPYLAPPNVPAGSCCGAARRLRGDHDGQGFSRRSEQDRP